MADIGIRGAMSPEVESLVAMLEDKSCEVISGITFHAGRLLGKSVVIAQFGIGKVFAAICCEIMILKYSPSLVINTGVGGALDRELKTGDIVIADKLCQYDMDTSPIGDPKGLISGINKIYFDTDSRAAKILVSAAESLGLSAKVGTIATGDRFVASPEDKNKILSVFPAAACEMEGGAIAHAAYINNTPFIVIRAISDSADGEATMDYPTFLPIAAKNSQNLTLALVKEW